MALMKRSAGSRRPAFLRIQERNHISAITTALHALPAREAHAASRLAYANESPSRAVRSPPQCRFHGSDVNALYAWVNKTFPVDHNRAANLTQKLVRIYPTSVSKNYTRR